jgi:hypothetical protein
MLRSALLVLPHSAARLQRLPTMVLQQFLLRASRLLCMPRVFSLLPLTAVDSPSCRVTHSLRCRAAHCPLRRSLVTATSSGGAGSGGGASSGGGAGAGVSPLAHVTSRALPPSGLPAPRAKRSTLPTPSSGGAVQQRWR